MKKLFYFLTALIIAACSAEKQPPIDREGLVARNCPTVTSFDSLSSLSVGNGEFAYTVDATGLQTFPNMYKKGVPLGTQAQWGWHSFANPENYRHDETLKACDFGRGKQEPYSAQFNEPGRNKEAADWFRVNPHRLHLGIVGFELGEDITPTQITDINQTLDMWKGVIGSNFKVNGEEFKVETSCHPTIDMIAARITAQAKAGINFRFPYPTGGHADDACNWEANDKHTTTTIYSQNEQSAILKRQLDDTTYYVTICWEGSAKLSEKSKNYFVLKPETETFAFTCAFSSNIPSAEKITAEEAQLAAAEHWMSFWKEGAAVDFSKCTDSRAKELERRVVLSQYLLAIQCAGSTPPQETGLTYNSWYGKFHLEMIWWHQAQFALWNRGEMLDRTLGWYETVAPVAREIARRQGFDGVRWMKMTDPSGTEGPSKVGSYLIWQQPHIIYLAELLYRANPTEEIVAKYNDLIQETAKFMYSFATYDELEGRFILKGAIPAQETLRAAETVNPPFELSYWHFAMETAQKWRERTGEKRNLEWDEMIDKLSPLAYNGDKLYLAAETATDTYIDIRYTSDHPAVLGAVGILPMNKLIREDYMKNTLNWIWNNWNWGKTWGWDYPMTAMNAARMGEPEKAVGALLMEKRTNTYLVNGHNYQDGRLRVYLPGNGGLLTAVAMMCAGWDGCTTINPGFPKDGTWNVVWEGLSPMP
ncbi:hypothetical protein [Bacteroides sp. 224]|uniref:hypothetical protein n=1 Tax=Bacteroides sp. 224 TaxID=2302936 RepID=UPI0013D51EB3|nr:hypothetical protein [Bacteroides sp. 224]NDV65339.1 hypothetical protein [Bacteroides sp. 224]